MTEQNIIIFLALNSKYCPDDKLLTIRDTLARISDDKYPIIISQKYFESNTLTAISFFFGGLGIERFIIQDTAVGILKFLTFGCCGILWLVALFTIGKKTKEKNFAKFTKAIAFP